MNAHQKIEKAIAERAASLDLSEMALNSLPASIGELKDLKVLNLSKNNLQTLPPEIGKLKQLKSLNLWNNSLHDLPVEFQQLNALEVLDLEDNHFTEIPSIVFKLSNLKSIDLEHNIISELRDDIKNLTSLQQLDVSRNKLHHINSAIGELKQLLVLNLKGNLLTELPNNICQLTQLKSLLVVGNPLEEALQNAADEGIDAVSEYFRDKQIIELIQKAKASNIFKLDLSGRGITELPEELFELKQLKILSLDHNEIWEIPNAITQLSALEVLDLSHNQLVSIPKIIDELPNLKFIETIGNPIAGSGILPNVVYKGKDVKQRIRQCKAKRTETLDLSDCGLTSIPKEVFQLKHLKNLILGRNYTNDENFKHRNYLTDIPEGIKSLQSLTHLDLTGNAFSNLSSHLSKLKNLVALNLSQNQFRKVPKGLFQISNQLEVLNLSQNGLSAIPNQFSKFNQLEQLDLSYNQLNNFPHVLYVFFQLKNLDLAYNKIKELPEQIGQLTALQRLNLANNKIQALPKTFANLTGLQQIDLSNNQINQLPGNIHQLRFNLKSLDVSNNQLTTVPIGFRHLLQLEHFDASNNKLHEVTDGFFELKQLRKLQLHHNKLKSIPQELIQLKALEEVDFTYNDFHKSLIRPVKKGWSGIKEWFNFQTAVKLAKTAKAKKLETLDISDLGLKTIPREVFGLTQLKTLKLGKHYHKFDDDSQQNCISNFTKNIAKLENLEVLIAPYNDFNSIPPEVFQLKQLRILDLAHNQIKAVPAEISSLTNLEYLDVNHNQLRKLPFEIANLTNLKEVHWNLNAFESPFKETLEMDLRSIKHWLTAQLLEQRIQDATREKATELDLSNLNMQKIPASVFKIKTLKTLNVSNNHLKFIPSEIRFLNRLEHLNFDNNQLQDLPNSISKLRKLRSLGCKDNPLTAIPSNVCNQDIESIQQWLIQQDINEKIDRILENTTDIIPPLYNKGIVVCQVCNGEEILSGYNPHMNIQFYQHTCYGCNGIGKIQYDSEHIHIILNHAQNNLQKVQKDLRKTILQKKNFEQSMLFSNSVDSPTMSRQVRKSHHNILKRYNSNLEKLSKRHQFYKDVQQRLHNVLYNQYLLYCAMDEFRKLDHLESGLSLNFEEKAALQKDIVEEVSNLNDFVTNSNGLAIPTDFIHIVGELADRYKAIL